MIRSLAERTIKALTRRTWIAQWRDEFKATPLRIAGGTITVGVLTNAFFLCLLGRQLPPWGIVLRGTLFLVGLACTQDTSDWNTLKRTSLVMKLLPKRAANP